MNRVLNFLGISDELDETRYPNLYHFLFNSKLALIDVGGRGGIVSAISLASKFSDIYVVEPENMAAKELRLKGRVDSVEKNYVVIESALASTPGPAKLFVTSSPGLDSILEPNHQMFDDYISGGVSQVVKEQNLVLETAKTAVIDAHGVDPSIIKLDTQGSELDILKSFGDLSGCQVVHLEVEFLEFYKNQPLFGEVNSFLHDEGFTIKDLKKTRHRKKKYADNLAISRGELNWGHALYFRDVKVTSNIRKLAACNLLFGFFESFREIMREWNLMTSDMEAELIAYSKQLARYQNLRFWHRKFLKLSHEDTHLKSKPDDIFF
jgi:FkbM family methyltransferase